MEKIRQTNNTQNEKRKEIGHTGWREEKHYEDAEHTQIRLKQKQRKTKRCDDEKRQMKRSGGDKRKKKEQKER